MIPTYEQMGDWLEEIAAGFPEVFFDDLDGGIQLEEDALPDPDFPPGEMYIMGEYVHDFLGRYILLYYGSFAQLLKEEDEDVWKDEIFLTVAYLGVALFGFSVLFQLVTLPVEFNASRRALTILKAEGILQGEEVRGARKVLSAAAMTYVAALAVSLLQLLRLLTLVNGRRR